MGVNNAEFHADFDYVEKVAKNLCKKVTGKWSFLFVLLCAKVFCV